MQAPKGTPFVLPFLLVLGCGAPVPVPELTVDPVDVAPTEGCAPVGNIRFICDLISPEDLAVIPGEEWVIASGNQQGGKIHLVSVRNKTTSVLFPNSSPSEEFDATSYPNCPGPIDPAEGEAFRAHGLYLTPGPGTIHKMFLVHHGSRESIEVFEIDSSGTPPVLTWIGCAVAPEAIRLNSVVGFPDGGFAATSFRSQDKPASSREDVLAGIVSGSVWEWHTESGWIEVPGSDTSGPNGLEIRVMGSGSTLRAGEARVLFGSLATRPSCSEKPWSFIFDLIISGCRKTAPCLRPVPICSGLQRKRFTPHGLIRRR